MTLRMFRRRALAALAASLSLFALPRPARADIWGGDIPLLTHIVANTTQTVSNLVSIITNLQQQVALVNTMLSKLDPVSFEAAIAFLRTTERTYEQLTRDMVSIGYSLRKIDGQFQASYGADYSKVPLREFDMLYAGWQRETLASAQVAVRSQSALSSIEVNTAQAANIVRNSGAADGVVAQLQAIVQMLHVLATQNNTIIHSLVTTGRVLATMAAGIASEQRLAGEKKRRHLEGYRDRGPDVPAMTSLP